MAIIVMLIIIILNIALLVTIMRIGTQGDHHSELSADQSTAVMTLQSRLGKSLPAPVATATDTQIVDTDSSADETDSE